jgi:3-oxoadipate enol-lactonase
VFAHGLAGSIAETRPFGSGVRGTRAFFHFRGHGGAAPATRTPLERWGHADLAAELRMVADDTQATRAVGLSLGAGAILRLLADTPDRFERVILLLPASLDTPRPDSVVRRMHAAADLVDRRDHEGLASALRDLQPEVARSRPDVVAWSRERAQALAGTPIAQVVRAFSRQPPLTDRKVLARCVVPVLVIGQAGDAAHPAEVAREVAAAFPRGELSVFPPGGLLWAHRNQVRERITEFLNDLGVSP